MAQSSFLFSSRFAVCFQKNSLRNSIGKYFSLPTSLFAASAMQHHQSDNDHEVVYSRVEKEEEDETATREDGHNKKKSRISWRRLRLRCAAIIYRDRVEARGVSIFLSPLFVLVPEQKGKRFSSSLLRFIDFHSAPLMDEQPQERWRWRWRSTDAAHLLPAGRNTISEAIRCLFFFFLPLPSFSWERGVGVIVLSVAVIRVFDLSTFLRLSVSSVCGGIGAKQPPTNRYYTRHPINKKKKTKMVFHPPPKAEWEGACAWRLLEEGFSLATCTRPTTSRLPTADQVGRQY